MDEAAIALELRWVRAAGEALRPAPPLPRGVVPQACHWPAACAKCGDLEALPYCTDPSRPYAAWTWRCPVDSGQPEARPPGQRWTWSHARNFTNVAALVRRTLSGDLKPPAGALEPDPAPKPWRVVVLLLGLLWASPASAYWLDLTGTAAGRCALVTGRDAKAVLRMAGVPGPLVRATVFLCDAPAGGVMGVAVSPTGRRVCELTGTWDGSCLTLAACGAVGVPLC